MSNSENGATSVAFEPSQPIVICIFLIYRYTEPGNKKVKNWKWKKYQGELKREFSEMQNILGNLE